uniref:Thioredoxin n=1 Tax=uncultured bacterium CSL142 TaxID=1091569 RepID=G4WVN6_9BACT|nr:thioredoxin [uncultured bacterium CSL142]
MKSEILQVVCPQCDTINRVANDRLNDGAKCGRCKQALFRRMPVALTQANFDRHISASDLPVVVDFWAPWCQPCRMMAPAYERAAAELEPRARLAKLDTEAEATIAARFGIRSIPTLIVFKHGREVARQSGALDLASIVEWVQPRAVSHARPKFDRDID